MPGRILTFQRQARELGRLRTGFTNHGAEKAHPVKSKTWVVTSHLADYVQAAAAQWGGTPEQWQPLGSGPKQWRVITETAAIDAFLPPGDPLSQAYEMWNKGGAMRRCDGITETLSDRPCMCLAQFGDEWFQRSKGTVCSPTTRLNVLLPDMEDFGVWRVETHSYYAGNEIAGAMDAILSGTGGRTALPVTLRIEQRSRVADGRTKHFPVVAMALRGITPRQALTGSVTASALRGGPQPLALEAAGPDYLTEAAQARTPDDVRDLWHKAKQNGHLTPALDAVLTERAAALGAPPKQKPQPGDEKPEVVEGVLVEPDFHELFEAITTAGRGLGWDSDRVEREFAARNDGTYPGSAEAADLRVFLTALQNGEIK
jgi:hypothetical protein